MDRLTSKTFLRSLAGPFTGVLATALLSLSAPSAHAVMLVYSNDVLGEIEPCGCRENPLGGMVRKANLVKKIAGDQATLQLDAGNLLFETDVLPDGLIPQRKVQSKYVLKTYELMGHDAITPGDKDFALGTAYLEDLFKKSKTHLLAANLKRKNGKLLFRASEIFTKKDPKTETETPKPLKIAVLGLVDPTGHWPSDVKASDPLQAAKAAIPALRKKSDLVIILSNLGFEADQKLAAGLKGTSHVDAIIGGRSQSFLQKPPTIENTIFFQSSFRNQYVGTLPLKKPLSLEGHQLTGLDPTYDDGAGTVSEMTKLVTEFKEKIAEANKAEVATLSAANSKVEGAVKYHTWPRCAECHMKQFDFWRKTAHGGSLQPLISKNQALNKDCLKCHSLALGDPDGYSNVNDLARLRGEDDHGISRLGSGERLPIDDLAALLQSIHEAKTVNDPVKIRRVDTETLPVQNALHRMGATWALVQCEHCHQAGKQHPFEQGYVKTVARDTCLNCHTPDQAPKWYLANQKDPDWKVIDEKRKLITCPAGELNP